MDGKKIKIGDFVMHKKTGWIGIVKDFMKKHPIALVDLTNPLGVKFRWIRIKDLKSL